MASDTYQSRANHRMLELQGVRLASFRRRAFAFSIDIGLLLLMLMLIAFFELALAKKMGVSQKDAKLSLHFSFKNWYSLASVAAYFGLVTYWWDGRTIGKQLMRIRVVSTLETRLKFWQSISRALGYATSALTFGYGFFISFFAENRMTTHDRLAGTIVVTTPMEISRETPAED